MARASMADLIARLRRMVDDPAGADQAWTDDQLQELLDGRRRDERYLELAPAATMTQDGAALYLDYYAPCGLTDWESDAALCDGGFEALTPSSADCLVGHWTLAESAGPPVYVVGKTYDMCAAAADTLEAWAAKTKLDYDITAGDEKLSRGQMAEALLALAARYRERQRAGRGRLVRTDLAGGGW